MAGLCTHVSTEDATGKPTAAVEGHNALLLLIPVDVVSSLTEEDSDWLLSMVMIVVSEWHKNVIISFLFTLGLVIYATSTVVGNKPLMQIKFRWFIVSL